MKFTKKQKELIKLILSGKIFDILSFAEYYKLIDTIRFNMDAIKECFESDPISKKFYRPNGIPATHKNILSDKQYHEKLDSGDIDPDNYICESLKLQFHYSSQTVFWDGTTYIFDFYKGVSTLRSFDLLVDFLIVWQFLRSEMLVLDVPQQVTAETLGLFFQPKENVHTDMSRVAALHDISLNNFSCSDMLYLDGEAYYFSTDKATSCIEYLGRKIIPSPKLALFVKHNFCTAEERTQWNALFAAWVAVLVSIILSFLPSSTSQSDHELQVKFYSTLSSDVSKIQQTVSNIVPQSEVLSHYTDIQTKLEEINQLLELILNSTAPTMPDLEPPEETLPNS